MEMMETSTILLNSSKRSLVIIDELGRGTGTHDGSAIAYATLEYLVKKVDLLTIKLTCAFLEKLLRPLVGLLPHAICDTLSSGC